MTTHALKALLITTLVATSSSAFAAESADLAVRGTIRPSACNVELSGGGQLDLGTISATTLSETAGTQVANSSMTMTVSCDAATRFGISTTDNRAGTVGATALAAAGAAHSQMMGLGTVNGTAVGGYTVFLLNNGLTGDGSSIAGIYSQNGGSTWTANFRTGALGVYAMAQPGIRTHGFANDGETAPEAFSTVTQPMSIAVYVNSTDTLPALTGGVPIDGSLTFQIQYL
ncbi:DUF1120 domain-containing protein [Cupriavidus sp. BIS7]|uniref:DUF1120 domain-containing protein n=1 Tax=Cupriavidus sp. BIS7 TaxID=1217718 RepID=UPI00035C41D9|nr:DUF1120 domain-containing protein [Cupriavidus sp. BIS7]